MDPTRPAAAPYATGATLVSASREGGGGAQFLRIMIVSAGVCPLPRT